MTAITHGFATIIPTFIYMVIMTFKKNDAGTFGAAWFVGTYLVWIPIFLITDRVTYVYYFLPTVGALCIGLGMGLGWLLEFWKRRQTGKLRWVAFSAVAVFLTLHLLIFAFMVPLNPLKIENWFFD